MVSRFLLSRPLCTPLPSALPAAHPPNPSFLIPVSPEPPGCGGQPFLLRVQKLRAGDSPNSSHRLACLLNRRGISETGQRKTNLQRRNFTLMTSLITHFLIRKSSLMRRFCQLTELSISTRTILAPRIKGVIAHPAQTFPQSLISFAKNADS